MDNELGYFSILRWRHDPNRDEAKNVAVLVFEAEGQFGALRAAPLSTVSKKLHDQGLLDAIIIGLEQRLSGEGGPRPNLADITEMHRSMRQSLYLTEPRPVAVADIGTALDALYKAYVSPRPAGSSALTKGNVLDRSISILRRRGVDVRRGQYVDDFIFDMVIGQIQPAVADVLSFGVPNKTWASVEYEAGHFLYALGRIDARGIAVIQAPPELGGVEAIKSHERVQRWMDTARVQVLAPADLEHVSL